jgi:hypothetical protein
VDSIKEKLPGHIHPPGSFGVAFGLYFFLYEGIRKARSKGYPETAPKMDVLERFFLYSRDNVPDLSNKL